MENKYIILTGATSGIGLETAKELHRLGFNLILGNRNPEKSKKLKEELLLIDPNPKVDIIHLDLASFASIKKFSETIKANYDHVDVLINNAGLLMKYHDVTEDGYEMTLGVNYLGTFLLTELLIDTLFKSENPKVIFLSSIVSKYGKCIISENFFKNNKKGFIAYFNSKLSLMMYARELEEKYRGKLIVKAVHPGVVFTRIWKWKSNLGKRIEKIQALIMKNAAEGAKMPIKLASTYEYDNDGNLYYNSHKCIKIPKKTNDKVFRKNFIEYTKKIVFDKM